MVEILLRHSGPILSDTLLKRKMFPMISLTVVDPKCCQIVGWGPTSGIRPHSEIPDLQLINTSRSKIFTYHMNTQT